MSEWPLREVDEDLLKESASLLLADRRILRILNGRGIRRADEIDAFLNPGFSQCHSPFQLSGMSEAVERIKKAISSGERIGIFADSDLDGLSSLAVMMSLFEKFSIIPSYRFPVKDEPYGLTESVVDEMADKRVTLLITVDSGMKDVNEIKYAVSRGIDVIVTDHHEQGDEIPPAIVVNPRLRECSYPEKNLAGVGVAYKTALAVLMSYLPVFNSRVFLIASKAEGFEAAMLTDGVVRETVEKTDFETLRDYIESFKDESSIMLTSEADYSKISPLFPGKKVAVLTPVKNGVTEAAAIRTGIIPLISLFKEYQHFSPAKIREFISSASQMVALGSIADIMPMTGENRVIICHGMRELESTTHENLRRVINGGPMSCKKIGWEIAPLLNTPGRFGMAEMTADFLLNSGNSEELVNEIKRLNEKRKRTVTAECSKVLEMIRSGTVDASGEFIFVNGGDMEEGLTGLVANRISDKYAKPVIVYASVSEEPGFVRGSGRAPEGFDFYSAVEPLIDLFERIGGHPQAFGFTASRHALNEIQSRISAGLSEKNFAAVEQPADMEIGSNDISSSFLNALKGLEPFGRDNPSPLFIIRNLRAENFTAFGAEKQHGRYDLINPEYAEAVGWNMARVMERVFHESPTFDVLGSLSRESFMGRTRLRVLIEKIRPSASELTEAPREQSLSCQPL